MYFEGDTVMSAIKGTLCGMLALLLAGCGLTVKESLTTNHPEAASSCAINKRIVVLPFADYTSLTDDLSASYPRNMIIMEALTDQLSGKGFRMPVQEDMLKYLTDNQIIKIMASDSANPLNGNLVNEMKNGEWSVPMREEISKLLNADRDQTSQAPFMNGLDQKTLAQIGQVFGARYIMRGRIIKYGMEQENTWTPLKKGLLPLFFTSTNRMLFGIAKSETYDNLGVMVIGGGIGAAIGNNATTPYTYADKIDPAGANATVWGIAGAGLGYLANQGGRTAQAMVELRLWVQNSETGEVIWTNRSEVSVTPDSVFAKNDQQELLKVAVTKAVHSLVNDF